MKYIKLYEESVKDGLIYEYYENGKIRSENYYVDGKRHRENGPAEIIWHKNGQLGVIAYFINGKKHREDGPAAEFWYDNGYHMAIEYCINYKYHREDGPAHQSFYEENGALKLETYFLYGREFPCGMWVDKLKVINSPYFKEEAIKHAEEYEDYLIKKDIDKYNL